MPISQGDVDPCPNKVEWIPSLLLPRHGRPLPSTVSFGSSEPRMSGPPHLPQANLTWTKPAQKLSKGQRTEQDKSVSTVRLLVWSNDIRTFRPSCIVPGTPGYIGDTHAKKTTESHHIMPISQGDVDSCSTLHGGNKTVRELAPTLRGRFSGRCMPRCEYVFAG